MSEAEIDNSDFSSHFKIVVLSSEWMILVAKDNFWQFCCVTYLKLLQLVLAAESRHKVRSYVPDLFVD